MKNVLLKTSFLLLLFQVGCSPRIKKIAGYEYKNRNSLKILSTFDKKGNKLSETTYGKIFDKVETMYYDKKQIQAKKVFNIFNDGSRELISYSTFRYDPSKKVETETMYIKDSLVWLIRQKEFYRRLHVIKTFSWENEATKIPDYKDAYLTTDSLFFDQKNRLIKAMRFSKISKMPFIELFRYTKNGYSYQTIGSVNDTLYNFRYSNEQRLIKKKLPVYQFYYPKKLEYSIDYY